MARYRIYHVNAAGTTLIEKILFDAPVATTNAVPNFSVSDTGSFYGIGETIVRTYSDITENPTLQMPFLKNSNEGYFDVQGGNVLQSQFDFANISIGDKFYLGRWDNSHSYIKVRNKTQTVTPNTRGDYELDLDYCLYDGTVVYSNVHIYCRWISSRNGIEFLMLPWLWNFNGTGGWNLCGEHIWFDLGAYGGYRENYIAPSSAANAQAFWTNVPIVDNNPYDEGGYSEPGGGTPHKQNWSENSDIVLPSPLPSETDYGAVACGLITIFTPTKNQLKKLSEVMWGQGFWNFVQNAIQNISDLFVSLAMVPFTVTAGDTVEVTWFSYDVGGQVPIGTGIMLTKAANQWYEFDMGTINLTGQGKGFATDTVLDYSPFSKLGIYLPFIGYQELDIDECRESPINLLYRIDILSGTTVALITINGRTIYQFTGNCLTQLPLTSMDAQTMLSNAVNIGIAAASAGATAAVASAGDAMTAENLAKDKISATAAEMQNAQHAASVSNAQGSLTSATANGILGMKPNFKKSGAVSASASLFNVMQPYLFLTTPRQSMPEGYQSVCGFPCNMGGTLGSFSGFTVVEDIRLNGLVATSPEVEEIYQLLKSGVII